MQHVVARSNGRQRRRSVGPSRTGSADVTRVPVMYSVRRLQCMLCVTRQAHRAALQHAALSLQHSLYVLHGVPGPASADASLRRWRPDAAERGSAYSSDAKSACRCAPGPCRNTDRPTAQTLRRPGTSRACAIPSVQSPTRARSRASACERSSARPRAAAAWDGWPACLRRSQVGRVGGHAAAAARGSLQRRPWAADTRRGAHRSGRAMQHTSCSTHHAAHNSMAHTSCSTQQHGADIAAGTMSSVACFRLHVACCMSSVAGVRLHVASLHVERRLLRAQAGGALGGPDALHHNRRQGPRVRAPPVHTRLCATVKQPCTGGPAPRERSRR